MYKVIIVEDEEMARKGIILTVDWNQLDCVVIGEAIDGVNGMALITKLNPDIVITDIKMPKMDGIEMVQFLREQGSEAEFIILTAYSDFSYAHNALKAEVADYLLKPFSDGDLERAVRKVVERILKRHAGSDAPESLVRFNISKGGKSKYVESAIQYISQHFGEPDLTASVVAEHLGISVGHLSRMFKKETDYTFGNYLTHYRIHTAMRLLKDISVKVYEVAEAVGYLDTPYFSTLFKKISCMSPSDYQNRCH